LGTFRRLVAAPVRVQAVVAGKVLATFVLGLTSMLVMWIAVSRVFGATWGGALPVVSLCVGVVLAAMGITSLAAALATTEEEADGIGAGLTFVLALLGGNFIQLYLLPSAMQRVARFTPNGWALRAFVDLTAGGRARAVAPAVAVLAAFGLVTGGLAASRAVRLHGYASLGSLERAVRLGVEAGGLVIPDDYDDRLRSGQHATVQLLVDPTRRQSIALGATVSALVSRESALVERGGVGPSAAVTPAGRPGRPEPRGFDYTAPSNLVLFMFITS